MIEVHKGGNVKNKFENKAGVWIVAIVEDQGLLLFYGGTSTVITSNFLDTPETVTMGPMLCILFLWARMHAIQMDPINGARYSVGRRSASST